MSSAYVETAELKGLSAFRVIVKHAAPNALAPIINVVALNLAYLVVGVVVVEVVFVYPGMGQYMVDAVTVRDVPVVQACGLIFAAVYILPEHHRRHRWPSSPIRACRHREVEGAGMLPITRTGSGL